MLGDMIHLMRHHAFIIEAEAEKGIIVAQEWLVRELGMKMQSNPDVLVLRYGLLSVEDARKIAETAAGAPFSGEHKAIIISASRVYHEAQNALLKLFEEPPPGLYLFVVLPSLGGLLPTLSSRVQELKQTENGKQKIVLPEIAEEFLRAGKERRTTLIKKLTSGRDEEERRENREEAIALLNGIEVAAYAAMREGEHKGTAELLSDVATLRGHLYDRSAPVRMILEHLSLVTPSHLL